MRAARRSIPLLAALVITVAGQPSPSAAEPPQGKRVEETAAWLIAQVDEATGAVPGPTGAPDWGLTIDVVLALHASGMGEQATAELQDAVAAHVADYAGPAWYPDPQTRLAGPTAKVTYAALVQGMDVHDVGGRDMRAELLDLVVADETAPDHGRARDRIVSAPGRDDSNVFSQALTVLALARSGPLPPETVTFLDKHQCSAGYFRMYNADGDVNPSLTCDGGVANGTSPSDVDGTAMGVQAMMAAQDAGFPDLDDDIDAGLDWLEGAQREDGSFGGGVSTSGSNSNSTGLAAQTLAAGAREESADRAAAYLRGLHVDASRAGGTALSTEVGAIAYNQAALEEGLSDGLDIGRDQWRRATPQAALGLSPVPFGALGRAPLKSDPPPARPAPGPAPDPTPVPTPAPTPAPTDPGAAPTTPTAAPPRPTGATGGGDAPGSSGRAQQRPTGAAPRPAGPAATSPGRGSQADALVTGAAARLGSGLALGTVAYGSPVPDAGASATLAPAFAAAPGATSVPSAPLSTGGETEQVTATPGAGTLAVGSVALLAIGFALGRHSVPRPRGSST